jgi:hypothetical protein
MPPTQRHPNQETRIVAAVRAVHKKRVKSIRGAARQFVVPYNTLYNRFHGVVSKAECRPHGNKLTLQEENELVEWVITTAQETARPSRGDIMEMTKTIMLRRENPPEQVITFGEQWITALFNRRPELRTVYPKPQRRANFQGTLLGTEEPSILPNSTVQRIATASAGQPAYPFPLPPPMSQAPMPIPVPVPAMPGVRGNLESESAFRFRQLEHQVSMLKELMADVESLPVPTQTAVNELIRSCETIMTGTVGLVRGNLEQQAALNSIIEQARRDGQPS